MRILIYSPPSNRAVDQQSVMELLINMGHDVYLLTQLPEGDLHKNAAKLGVKTFSAGMKNNAGLKAYYKNTRHLIRFIKEHKIAFVFAHLQGAGLAAGIAKYFTKFRLVYVRHNADEHKLPVNRNAIMVNWLVNKLSPRIIAISGLVERYLINIEKIRPSKILRINLGYNFEEYLKTDRTGNAAEIRQQFPARMLIISVARLIPVKRHLLMFETIKELLKQELDVKLVCLSEGSFRGQLQEYIDKNGLGNNVFLLGAKRNVFDYFEAGDLFLHLSGTEASNNAAKEAGYCKRPAIVCKGVGDFEDYIENGINGYLVDKDNAANEAAEILKDLYHHPEKLKVLGDNIRKKVIDEFDIQNVRPLYERLLAE
ncbi:MAG: glycosyltransferase family 4 protein [Bacteroidota bacterium]